MYSKYINPATGKIDLRYNPLSPDEDIWVPVRGGPKYEITNRQLDWFMHYLKMEQTWAVVKWTIVPLVFVPWFTMLFTHQFFLYGALTGLCFLMFAYADTRRKWHMAQNEAIKGAVRQMRIEDPEREQVYQAAVAELEAEGETWNEST